MKPSKEQLICRRPFLLVLLLAAADTAVSADYWVAPDGDDHAAGTSREAAWASPSRGQPSRVRVEYGDGDTHLYVLSTYGFLPSGEITVAGETRAYSSKTADAFVLMEPFQQTLKPEELVYDATILGGDSFDPGDVVYLAGGTYVDRPLWFCRSGKEGKPITYRSAVGERALLLSTAFNLAPVKRLGGWRKERTAHVIIKDLAVENHADGNHGAGGVELHGVADVVIDGCEIDISGRDINGDNDGIKLFGANNVVVKNCRIRSRQANGIAARQSNDIQIVNCVVYESFHGIFSAGGKSPAHVRVDRSTIYAIHTYGALYAEAPGTLIATNCIVAESPSNRTPAVRGNGNGDHNNIWHAAEAYGEGWNGGSRGEPGARDLQVDPLFISRNPHGPYFLRIPHDSPAARGGKDSTYMGAFAPISPPMPPQPADYNVRDFGAVGDGITDDLPALRSALAKASEAGAGRIVFPPTDKFYLISDTLNVRSDRMHLYGPGATIKLKDDSGRMDTIRVGEAVEGVRSGPALPVVENVKIEGFVIDGNYRRQPQDRRGGHPRGVWCGNAHNVMLKDLTIVDTYSGVTFGPGSRDCVAVDVTVTNWDHDAFGASGRGIDGSCTDIRFIRCRAIDTPRCVKAWEIEEGAARVLLEDCLVENLGGTGTGYYVRHHEYRWPLNVTDVTFVRCKARNLTGAGFIVTTTPGTRVRAVKPNLRTRSVQLVDCETDAPVRISCGVENVVLQGGSFEDVVAVGVGDAPPSERDSRLPVRSVTIRNARVGQMKINAKTGNANAKLGDDDYPDYEPRIRLENVRWSKPPEITGNRDNVTIVDEPRSESPGESDQLLLVVDGRPASTIVVADDADWWQRMAAGWLQTYVERATGARLPLANESEAVGGTLISVGHTRLAASAGISTNDLKWDGCRLAVRGNVLYLLGRDSTGAGRGDPSPQKLRDFHELDPWSPDRIHGIKGSDLAGANGTCKAVVTFLESVCDVRWFMPFDQGIVVPKRDTLSVPRSFEKVVVPPFAYAIGSFLYGSPRLYPSAYANNLRYGIRLKTFGGHSWYHWVSKGLFQEHPEYFAMRDGKRTAEGNHLCTSNPEVQKLLLAGIRREFDNGYDWVQLGQSDGWKRCECERCEAMDNFKPWDQAVDGPDWHKWLHTTNRDNPVDRLHVVHNWVAEQCAISHPGRIVHYLAYIPTRWPSKSIDVYSPNVVAELCHDIPEMLEAWSNKVSAMTVYKIWWDMSWVYGHAPDVTPKEVADEVRKFHRLGVIGFFNGGDGNNWGLNGPVFYTLGRMLGDPTLDENELVREYCRGVYGGAGEAMIEFFRHLYGPVNGGERPLRRNRLQPDAPHAQVLHRRFPPTMTLKLDELIRKAESVGVIGAAADNLRMTRLQFDYLRLVSNMWSTYEAHQLIGSRESLLELKARVDAFEDYRQRVLFMDADDAALRFPDWGQLCKWLAGGSYWHAWKDAKNKIDLTNLRGRRVGYYAKIREPLNIDFSSLELLHGTVATPGGGRLGYHVRGGRGPTLVLIPGSWGDYKVFMDVLRRLDRSFHVVIVELRGHGDSQPPTIDGSMESFAADVLRVTDALDLDEFYVGGHSIGGMVSIELLKQRPQAILGAISIEGWTHHRVAKEAFGGTITSTLTPEQEKKRQANRARVLRGLTEQQIKAFASVWRRWDGSAILEHTKRPVLELWGDRGKNPPSREAMRIPVRDNIELVWLKGASHSLLIERPTEVARRINAFVARVEKKKSSR